MATKTMYNELGCSISHYPSLVGIPVTTKVSMKIFIKTINLFKIEDFLLDVCGT